MRRSWMLVAVPVLVGSLLGGGAPVGARDTSCANDGVTWPRRLDVIGTAFTGRPVQTWVNRQGVRVYVFDVLKVKVSPPLPDQVRVRLQCVATPFKLGERYLVSSSNGFRRDGVVRFDYSDIDGAAWRVSPDNHVTLMGYGPDTAWADTPRYLDRPETLAQAVKAVTPVTVGEGL